MPHRETLSHGRVGRFGRDRASLALIFGQFYLANLLNGKQHIGLFMDVYVGIESLLGPTPSCNGKQLIGQGFLSGKLLVPKNMSSKPFTWETSWSRLLGWALLW